MWRLILLLITVLYGGVTFLGAVSQLKEQKLNNWSAFSMIIGSVFIIISTIFNVIAGKNLLVLLIIGLILIHISAINNGLKMYGKIHLKHHLIRLVISVLIVMMYLKVI
ncbi:MAG: hypothetical protein PHX70_09900 [Clostridium sp.]|nr:hypothetical protein [Clostridium sp.]